MQSYKKKHYLINTLLSIGISFLLLGLLIYGVTGATGDAIRPKLVSILAQTSLGFIGLYLLTSIAQTLLRALRYGVILKTSSENTPGKFHLFLVAMSRNMFVDMLPARLGELSYIAMLNRGFRVGADACLSSLAISFVFDLIALALLLLALMGYQLIFADLQPWIIGTFLMILLVSGILLLCLFPVLQWLNRLLAKPGIARKNRLLQKLFSLIEHTTISLQQARQGKIIPRLLALSLGVRIFKYLGLYLIFLGVVLPSFPDIHREFSSVLIALISAEAGASLPVPAFMSFGTYEAGGAFALIALGAAKSISVIAMLALHIWSQVVDYALGIAAMITFIFIVSKRSTAPVDTEVPGEVWKTKKIGMLLPAGILLSVGLLFFAFQLRTVKKMGSFRPPKPGIPVLAAGVERPASTVLAGLRGFVIWSSNRFGNHDLVMLTLPDQQLTRLTTDPHTEFFPRISPDGSKVVFCRSQEPWVSQRNKLLWDTWLLDLPSGDIRLLAKNARSPSWSADGKKIYFQRHATQVVEYTLASQKEIVIFASGKNLPIDARYTLNTPVWDISGQHLAVTLRGPGRGTFIISRDATFRQVGQGCELNWAPDGSFLYYVDDVGREKSFFKVDPETLERKLWYNAPGKYSHQYWPKLSNTGDVLVFGASTGGHEHDKADYEIFLWPVNAPVSDTARLSFHTGNDNWPDIFLY